MQIKDLLKNLKSYISCILRFPYFYAQLTYSQEGEDIIIEKYFHNLKEGYFIDIGAYHPYKYSNTYKLSMKGWNGINIEPGRTNYRLFQLARRNDINLNIGIGYNIYSCKYYVFEDEALNSYNINNYKAVINSKQSMFSHFEYTKIVSISEVFKKYIKKRKINLLNIDTEGTSFKILRSVDLNKYNINMIVIERSSMGIHIPDDDKITQYLKRFGYILLSSTTMSFIFVKPPNRLI